MSATLYDRYISEIIVEEKNVELNSILIAWKYLTIKIFTILNWQTKIYLKNSYLVYIYRTWSEEGRWQYFWQYFMI